MTRPAREIPTDPAHPKLKSRRQVYEWINIHRHKNNKEHRKAKPPPEERQYSKERIENIKKSKAPLIPT
jgi:hypothetical protein